MKITRLADTQPFVAPNRYDILSLRLQVPSPGGPENFWTGLPYYCRSDR